MWNYEKRLQYPVKITQTNPKMAQVIISQFGGPDSRNIQHARKRVNHAVFWHFLFL